MKKSTDELLNILKHSPDLSAYLKEEEENISSCPLSEYLNRLCAEKTFHLHNVSGFPVLTALTPTKFSQERKFPAAIKCSPCVTDLDCLWMKYNLF